MILTAYYPVRTARERLVLAVLREGRPVDQTLYGWCVANTFHPEDVAGKSISDKIT
jgi:hypothetical protein